jgi:hypothetical protein
LGFEWLRRKAPPCLRGGSKLTKRSKNVLAMLAIGDGEMQIIAPQEHEHLWMVGPAWLSKAKGIGRLAENPRYSRLLGAAQVGGAVWFALRYYRGT